MGGGGEGVLQMEGKTGVTILRWNGATCLYLRTERAAMRLEHCGWGRKARDDVQR